MSNHGLAAKLTSVHYKFYFQTKILIRYVYNKMLFGRNEQTPRPSITVTVLEKK